MSPYEVESSLVYSSSRCTLANPQTTTTSVPFFWPILAALLLVILGSLDEVLLGGLGVYKYAIFHITDFQSSSSQIQVRSKRMIFFPCVCL